MRHAEVPISIVVGASGVGIGPTVAERLASRGHHVAIVGRREDRLQRLADDMHALGAGSVRIHAGDATKPKKVRRFVDDMLIHYGRVDNLVYTPAAATFGPFLKTDLSDLEDHLDITVRGPWHWMQALIPVMQDHGGGSLIFMSATAGKRGFPSMSAFSTAKAAMHGLLESVAREHREEGIQPVSLVLDGLLDHPGMRNQFPDKDDWSDTISMDNIADAVEFAIGQDLRGMVHELWLTPGKERW